MSDLHQFSVQKYIDGAVCVCVCVCVCVLSELIMKTAKGGGRWGETGEGLHACVQEGQSVKCLMIKMMRKRTFSHQLPRLRASKKQCASLLIDEMARWLTFQPAN